MSRVTLVEVARLLGVAPSTVSRAFNQPQLLRPETVDRVLATATEVGYVPNRHAQALITGRSGVIGLVVPDLLNPFFPPLVRAAQHEAAEHGLTVVVAETDRDAAHERRQVRSLLSGCEGLVIVSSRLDPDEIVGIAADHPTVLINTDVPGVPRALVTAATPLREAISELAAAGARRFAYVGGPPDAWAEWERKDTVVRLAAELGLEATYAQAATGTYAEAREVSEPLATDPPDVVVAFDDIVAHAVMHTLAEHGIAVPDDIRLVGCDDALPIETRPQLSTIRLPTPDAATWALRRLVTGDLSDELVELPGVYERRGTT